MFYHVTCIMQRFCMSAFSHDASGKHSSSKGNVDGASKTPELLEMNKVESFVYKESGAISLLFLLQGYQITTQMLEEMGQNFCEALLRLVRPPQQPSASNVIYPYVVYDKGIDR